MLNKKIIWIIILSFGIFTSAQAGWFDNKIKVRKCYQSGSVWSNYKEYHNHQVSLRIQNRSSVTKWDWDLNLKNKKALRITEIDGQTEMTEFSLLSSDNLITVNQGSGFIATFDTNKETVRVGSTTWQCVFK